MVVAQGDFSCFFCRYFQNILLGYAAHPSVHTSRAQAAATQAVEREGRGCVGKAAVDGCHARQVHVMDIGMNHIAEDHMLHLFWLDPRSLDHLADYCGGQFSRWLVLQTTAIISNRGADTAQNDNFCLCHVLCSPSALLLPSSEFYLTKTPSFRHIPGTLTASTPHHSC